MITPKCNCLLTGVDGFFSLLQITSFLMPNESLIFHLYIGSFYLTLKIAAVKGEV